MLRRWLDRRSSRLGDIGRVDPEVQDRRGAAPAETPPQLDIIGSQAAIEADGKQLSACPLRIGQGLTLVVGDGQRLLDEYVPASFECCNGLAGMLLVAADDDYGINAIVTKNLPVIGRTVSRTKA